MSASERTRRSQRGDEAILNSLLLGSTFRTAAETAGVSEATVRRRMASPEFRAALDDARRDLLGRISATAANGAMVALRVLIEACSTPSLPWAIRVSAARTLVSTLAAVDSHVVLDARIGEVERALLVRSPLTVVRP